MKRGLNNNNTSNAAGQQQQEGKETFVMFVQKPNAKTVKSALEARGWLDKDYRMTSAAKSSGHSNGLAIPVVSLGLDTFLDRKETNTIESSASNLHNLELFPTHLVVGTGQQFCPFSSAVLGNPSKRHALMHPSTTKDQGHATTNQNHWSPLHQALYETLQQHYFNNNNHNNNSRSIEENQKSKMLDDWKAQIQNLDASICPSKVEFLGDDHNLVLPPSAFLPDDLHKLIHNTLTLPSLENNMEAFLTELWKQMSHIFHCPRILRKGGVDPNSQIRHTGYQLLWPPKTTTTTIETTTSEPKSIQWITVTEQGIRQSFDVTQVMFSRGNITEKIRFGKVLVQPKDVVLDLYAGIGYYTLPALLHGGAAFVYACEWNPTALQALTFNVNDNRVDPSQYVVLSGDCRHLVLPNIPTATTNNLQINRVSLGLLPSSEGSWRIAVQAIMGTVPREPRQMETTTSSDNSQQPNHSLPAIHPLGGWLHIHGNVPVKEKSIWAQWLTGQLHQYIRDEMDKWSQDDDDWVVICHHVEKVKSFAPTVNHYVADVFVGPRSRACRVEHPQYQQQDLSFVLLGQQQKDCCCFVWDSSGQTLVACPQNVPAPSCALSDDGVLHQEWMRPPE